MSVAAQIGADLKQDLHAVAVVGWRTVGQRLVVLCILGVPGVARCRSRADCADDLRGCRDPRLAVDVPPAVRGEGIAAACAKQPARALHGAVWEASGYADERYQQADNINRFWSPPRSCTSANGAQTRVSIKSRTVCILCLQLRGYGMLRLRSPPPAQHHATRAAQSPEQGGQQPCNAMQPVVTQPSGRHAPGGALRA